MTESNKVLELSKPFIQERSSFNCCVTSITVQRITLHLIDNEIENRSFRTQIPNFFLLVDHFLNLTGLGKLPAAKFLPYSQK